LIFRGWWRSFGSDFFQPHFNRRQFDILTLPCFRLREILAISAFGLTIPVGSPPVKNPHPFGRIIFAATIAVFLPASAANPVVRFQTDLGTIDVTLLEDSAPKTVANFLGYVNRHDYDNTFIHRSVSNFIIQGGGYRFVAGNVNTIPQQSPVVDEFHVSNTRGTLAIAKGSPDSATSQWFFNESDANAASLDSQNGGFTVFGRIVSSSGLAVMDAIGAVPTHDFGSPFDQLPVRNYTSGAVQDANLIHVISVRELVTVTPLLSISRLSANTVRLTVNGAPATAYGIQSSTSLLEASFSALTTLTTDATGSASYDSPATEAKRFYRIAVSQ
jgi:cyclophilin family peptidyl-prolyl cis-trans isomerase